MVSKYGPNPMTSIYNASVVNFYNAMGSLARFENKNILFYFEKRSSLLQRWRCSCKFKSRRIGSWFQNMVSQYGLKIWFQNMVSKHGFKTWFQNMVSKYVLKYDLKYGLKYYNSLELCN
jgi:hypothetical protein